MIDTNGKHVPLVAAEEVSEWHSQFDVGKAQKKELYLDITWGDRPGKELVGTRVCRSDKQKAVSARSPAQTVTSCTDPSFSSAVSKKPNSPSISCLLAYHC